MNSKFQIALDFHLKLRIAFIITMYDKTKFYSNVWVHCISVVRVHLFDKPSKYNKIFNEKDTTRKSYIRFKWYLYTFIYLKLFS